MKKFMGSSEKEVQCEKKILPLLFPRFAEGERACDVVFALFCLLPHSFIHHVLWLDERL